MDEIDADETRAKVYAFIDDLQFPKDCESLGFDMDCFNSFNAKYNYNPAKHSKKRFEKLVANCDDFCILGNAIFSQWRYYNHWADDVKAEFKTRWFMSEKFSPLCSRRSICSSTVSGFLVYCIVLGSRNKIEDPPGALFCGKRGRSYRVQKYA